MGCPENLCLCNNNFYGTKGMLENNLYIGAKTILVEGDEDGGEVAARVVDLVYVSDLGARSYLIYLGKEMVGIEEQIMIEKLADVCAENTLNEIFEICDSIAIGIAITSLKDEEEYRTAMDRKQVFEMLCETLEEDGIAS